MEHNSHLNLHMYYKHIMNEYIREQISRSSLELYNKELNSVVLQYRITLACD